MMAVKNPTIEAPLPTSAMIQYEQGVDLPRLFVTAEHFELKRTVPFYLDFTMQIYFNAGDIEDAPPSAWIWILHCRVTSPELEKVDNLYRFHLKIDEYSPTKGFTVDVKHKIADDILFHIFATTLESCTIAPSDHPLIVAH